MFELRKFLGLFAGLSLVIAGCGQRGGDGGETTTVAATTDTRDDDSGEEAAPVQKKELDPATVGVLKVSVKYAGDKIRNKKIKMGADQFCASAHEKAAAEEKFVRNENMTMANALVHIDKGLAGYSFDTPDEEVLLDQQGCVYIPHVVSVMKKQPLKILNSDDTLHNVHPTPRRNKEKNIAMPFKGKSITEKFRKDELSIPVKCNVHPWMISYVHVLKHPYHAVTPEGDGMVTLDNVPPGTYTLEAVHEELGKTSVEVTLGEKETKEVVLEYKAAS